MLFEKLGGRKFLAFMLTLIVGVTVELATSKGLTTNLLTLLLASSAAYTALNVVQKRLAGGGESEEGEAPADVQVPAAPSVDLTAITAELEAQRTAQAQTLEAVNALTNYIVALTQPKPTNTQGKSA